MTLCTLGLAPDVVRIVTDTLVLRGDRPWCFSTKIVVLPHVYAALVARGPSEWRTTAAEFINSLPLPGGIEDALPALPALLRDLGEAIAERYPEAEDLDGEVVVAGWAASARQFRAWWLASLEDFEPIAIEPGAMFLPAGTDGHVLPGRPVAEAGLIRLARAQHARLGAEAAPGWSSVGGDLIMTEITATGITQRKVARLPGFDQARGAMRHTVEQAAQIWRMTQ